MARAFGRILSTIWDDQDFLNLDVHAQRLYVFLCSQPNLNHAGLLPLTVRRWSAKAKGLTAQQVRQSLADLDAARFLVVDEETEEVLVRSFVRRDEVYKQPRVMGSAVSGALEMSSRRLRRALLAEMDRLPLHELSDEATKQRNGSDAPSIRAQVMAHIEVLRRAFVEPSPPPSAGGCEPPSGTPSPTPSAPPSAGPSEAPGEGGPEGDAEGLRGTRAGARDPLPLALTPTPTPVPPTAGAAARAPEPADSTAQTILGEYLERCAKRPPGTVIGQLGKQLKAMLAEGIDPDDIRRGMSAWMAKGLHPSTLPSVVNEVMNGARPAPAQRGSNDQWFADAMARAIAADAAETAPGTPPRREITA